MNGKF